MGQKFKKGDAVSDGNRFGLILGVYESGIYPIEVMFSGNIICIYTIDGKVWYDDEHPSLFKIGDMPINVVRLKKCFSMAINALSEIASEGEEWSANVAEIAFNEIRRLE